MKRILVTGAGGNASQNFIASLRMAPEPFYIVGTDTNPYHLATADVEQRHVLPQCDAPGYLEALFEVAVQEDVAMIHPQPDVEVAFLSAHRAALPFHWLLPDDKAIRTCHDKMQTNAALADHGVPVPRSYAVWDLGELEAVVASLQRDGGTVWVRAIRGAGSRAALPVRSASQARHWIAYWCETKGLTPGDFMLAAFLPGREFAFQSLWHDGQLVTSMARERMEYLFGNLMPSGQSSSPSVARTVHRDDVNAVATRAVKAVDPHPHGVYCVDLKENGAGEPCVTEINIGRFFTTSNFFSAAGCNMPHHYVRLAHGEALPDLPAYNALAPELYWVRGVDRTPHLMTESPWTARRVA